MKENPFSPPEATLGNTILFSSLAEHKMLPSTFDHKHGLSLVTSSSWLSSLSLSLSYTSKTSSPSSCPAWIYWGKVKEERKEERLYLIATLLDSIMLPGSVKGLKLLFSRHVWELLGLSSIITLCCYFFDASNASPVGLVTRFFLQLLGLHQWPKAHSVCWAATLPISTTEQDQRHRIQLSLMNSPHFSWEILTNCLPEQIQGI